MFRATREFIKARQPHASHPVRLLNDVFFKGGGKHNQCFANALAELEKSKKRFDKVTLVSGWLVQAFDKLHNHTLITQHWWNCDSKGQHYDTTLLNNYNVDYVIDMSIAAFGNANFDEIRSSVGMTLLYENNQFKALCDEDEMMFVSLEKLKTEYLFHYL